MPVVLISITSASLRGCDSVATPADVFDLVLYGGPSVPPLSPA